MRYIFMGLIWVYRKIISPLFPPCCKYHPTCSAYALESFRRHGIIKGFILSSWRILRCNPWSMGGIDFVPEEFHIFRRKKHIREQDKEE